MADVWNRLENVEINELQKGLLNKFLENPIENSEKIVDLLRKIQDKNNGYHSRRVGKIIPLFDKHDFWFTQPVPKYFQPVELKQYDKAIEVSTVADVQ